MPIYYNLGFAYYNSGQYSKAIECYDKVLELNPSHTIAHYDRGMAYYKKDLYELASNDFSLYIGLNPDIPLGYYSRGLAQYYLGNISSAKEDWQTCRTLAQKEGNTKIYDLCNEELTRLRK